MKFFIHPLADVLSTNVGSNTRIWQFCVVLSGARIGENCNICAQVFIENDVVIGNNVTIKNGVQLWDGVRIEDNVFIGPNVTFTNDRFPRSKQYPEFYAQTIIKRGASVGANTTILPGLVIGEKAMVGAGTVVTRSVPPNAIVVGNPANIVGYIDVDDARSAGIHLSTSSEGVEQTAVAGVTIHNFPIVTDMRGSLTVGEFENQIPFKPLRYFMVFGVPSRETRGEHAHHRCHQFLICVRGSCSVVADNGNKRTEVVLDAPSKGVYLPPMIWGVQYKYTSDAILLVFASDHYDADDYIRNYEDFLKIVHTRSATERNS